MLPRKVCLLVTSLTLLLTSRGALAQGVLLPSQDDIAKAMEKAREAMTRTAANEQNREALQKQPSSPDIGAIPKPAVPAPDVASIAEKYKNLGRIIAQEQQKETSRVDLLVLISLSMPREALDRIIDQAERAGATLVFRGLKGDSMLKMTEEVRALIGKRSVNIAIHPPAFQQFSVTRVPAIVLARGESSNVMENGCAKPDTFVKVAGDVSLDYALDYIERTSAAWAHDARRYRAKIVRGL